MSLGRAYHACHFTACVPLISLFIATTRDCSDHACDFGFALNWNCCRLSLRNSAAVIARTQFQQNFPWRLMIAIQRPEIELSGPKVTWPYSRKLKHHLFCCCKKTVLMQRILCWISSSNSQLHSRNVAFLNSFVFEALFPSTYVIALSFKKTHLYVCSQQLCWPSFYFGAPMSQQVVSYRRGSWIILVLLFLAGNCTRSSIYVV